MFDQIPTASVIRDTLAQLTHAQMQELAKASDVPFTTLWKIKTGETKNPGIDTVGLFIPHLPSKQAA